MTKRVRITKRQHTITLAAAGFLAWCAIGVPAEPIAWLYEVQVPVASQTEAERQRATRHALVEVLGRVTGSAQVPITNAITGALAAPVRYTRRYQFTSAPPGTVESTPGKPSSDGLLFDVGFDPAAVLALVRDAQLPIWGANRPTILVWLAVRGGGRNNVVVAGGADGWAAALRKRARQRGIALALPLMDLRDLETPTAAVWGFFWEHIEAASRRYGADLLLAGRATLGHDGWWTDWELREPARFDSATFAADSEPPTARSGRLNIRYHHQAGTLQEAARAAVDEIADGLAARFAVRGDHARGFQATVYGAQTVRRYATLLAHLGAQEYIDRVDVLAATPQTLDIRLHTRSDIAQLAELLAQDDRLAVNPNGDRMDITWQERE